MSVDQLAARTGLRPEHWDVDGLGPAVGALCRLPSGIVIQLRELEHAVTYYGARGPDISADLGEIAAHGIETIRDQALAALGLTLDDVTAQPSPEAAEEAREFLAQLKQRRV